MNRHERLIRYNDFLVLILIVLIGASLFLTGFFAVQFRESSDFSEMERLSYRNRLVQLEIENRIRRSRQRVMVASRSYSPGISFQDLSGILHELNSAPQQLSGTEWRLFDSVDGELLTEERGHLVHAETSSPTVPWRTETAPEGFPFLTLYRETKGEIPRGAVVFGPDSAIADRHYALLLVDLTAIAKLLESEVSIPVSATVINWAGNQLVEARLGSDGVSEIHTEWEHAGFADAQKAPPYLGIMNLYLGQSPTPRTRRSDDSIHSLIPLPALEASIVLRDRPIAPKSAMTGPAVLIAVVGLILYTLIVMLFVGYRRTVVGQTRRLNELSEQKNLLFSLLSHNLKNNLAAIAAEAHADPSEQRILAPVADASRVISNSLYYLQFQERSFAPPPLEPVEINDLVELLTLRCGSEADAKSQTLDVGNSSEHVVIQTNLTMALEALERILVNAIQYSPDASKISINTWANEATAGIVIADSGPGLPSGTIEVYQQAMETATISKPHTEKNLRGIGVYVARSILGALGARLRVVDTGADGTRVSAEFPRIMTQ